MTQATIEAPEAPTEVLDEDHVAQAEFCGNAWGGAEMFAGRCSCGWEGQMFYREYEADMEADEHVTEAKWPETL